ncbi:methyltransferase [Psychrobacter sp. FDAARGOS_221]|uniref:methyltransferase n=1 Tax=Psychrobacter sp. FDAARGOS_221 TaxID=1975705 RepID=UPI000BB57E32|nr:methyltransferase [Psychrobacter sp. FDAARGOS_221]PNK59740.1 methyltransferase [Psychrobacter sp. FDAARGOS_221]
MEKTSTNQLTHQKSRAFKPEKLTVPRDFQLPRFLQRSNQQHNASGDIENNTRPLIVEIGAGKGRHAILYANGHPEHDIIAIERTLNKFTAFEASIQAVANQHQADSGNEDHSAKNATKTQNNSKLPRLIREMGLEHTSDLTNLLAVHADAIPYCVHALPPQSVDVFYLLYPNPEPKNPNQQWLNMPFFEFLLSRLKPEGRVVLASNIEDYIDNAYQQALETWQLDTERKEVATDSQRTHFEIKYLARGETCWELNLTKPKGYVTRFDQWQAETTIS